MPIDHASGRNMPCALCEATGQGDKIMIPSHYVYPDGWHKEHNGYIMAGDQNKLCTQYCITGYIQSRNFCRTSNRLNFKGCILVLAHAQ